MRKTDNPDPRPSSDTVSPTAMAALNSEPKRNWWQRLRDCLWGYDFFVSYHWARGGIYAVNLAEMLRTKRFDVFLDRSEFASGDDWKLLGQIALRNTQRLVLVATREAVTESPAVDYEVEVFTARGRQIIPIIFTDTFEDLDRDQYPTLSRFPDSIVFIDSGAATLAKGPSSETVGEVIRTLKVLRRRNLRAILMLIPVIIVAAFAAFSTYQWRDAKVAEMEAVASAEAEAIARESASKERDRAVSQRNLAISQKLALSAPRIGLRIRDDESAALAAIQAHHFWERSASSSEAITEQALRTIAKRRMFCVPFKAHTATIESLSISTNCDLLASSASNGEVTVFKIDERPISIVETIAATGEISENWPKSHVAFADEGRLLLVSSGGATKLFAVSASLESIDLPNDIRQSPLARISADGSRIAVFGPDRLSVWNFNGRSVTRETSAALDQPFANCAISKNGDMIAGLTKHDLVELWVVENDELKAMRLKEPPEEKLIEFSVGIIGFTPDSKWLIASCYEPPKSQLNETFGRVFLWNMSDADVEPLKIEESGLLGWSVTSDSRWLATCSTMDALLASIHAMGSRLPESIAIIRVWDLANPTSEPSYIQGESRQVTALCHSEDEQFLVSGNVEGGVRLWEWNYEPASVIVGKIADNHLTDLPSAGAIVRSGEQFVTGDGILVRIFDDTADEYIQPVFLQDDDPEGDANEGELKPVRFESGGPAIEVAQETFNEMASDLGLGALPRNPGATIYSAATSKDGNTIILGCTMGVVRWSRSDNRWSGLARSKDHVVSVSSNSAGSILASVDLAGELRVWRDGKPLATLRPDEKPLAVAVSPSGKSLATVSKSGFVSTWSVRRNTLTKTHTAASNLKEGNPLTGGRCIVFSDDGDMLAVADIGNKVRVFNYTGKGLTEQCRLSGATGSITCIAFHPKLREVLAGSRDGSLRRWKLSKPTDAPTIIAEHSGGVIDLAHTKSGDKVFTIGSDALVRRTVATSSALLSLIKAKVRRNMSQNEWDELISAELPYEPTISTAPPFLGHGETPKGKD